MKSELMDKIEGVESVQDMAPHTAAVVSEASISQEELLRQFQLVKRLTKGFLAMTWVVLMNYVSKNGIDFTEWLLIAIFLMVTVQLWSLGPRK